MDEACDRPGPRIGARVVLDVTRRGENGDDAGPGEIDEDGVRSILDLARDAEVAVLAGMFNEECPGVALSVDGRRGDAGGGLEELEALPLVSRPCRAAVAAHLRVAVGGLGRRIGFGACVVHGLSGL
ncbi:hypothetical protein R6V09_41065 [Streptomyces sp. W16]|uniref:hypothetical protein n=1 Tax=Streptomyces sp. W16 TaxID=3076631 RepID=UPI00295BB9A7|nr:hypothetical protein [Streptomyces sp. W16]MDV9176505.1 hypothetical protein [Streptomyces sp. W16]